ncbi:GrpB family protein [Inhella crocodyli]|uniref:GrpB family protein n=1 Tax=Inhella crocodyli TaxID=2499851 RepID=A0A3S2UD05_9BURK|nr:GrpB family protein [Inhella crocodyli]RVT84773.1 GrpB family protein [Inhella crocodyli]
MPTLHEAADYQPLLRQKFEQVRHRLLARWPTARIEHIGASSLPGAVSKGDLDVLMLVAPKDLEAVRMVLVDDGYTEKTDTLRTSMLCMLEAHDHAVQLVAAGSRHERDFLTFRDRLRADPHRVAEYNALKRQHAGASDADYRAAKAAFIQLVLR